MALNFGPQHLGVYPRNVSDVSVRSLPSGQPANLSQPVSVDALGNVSFTVASAGRYVVTAKDGSTQTSRTVHLSDLTPYDITDPRSYAQHAPQVGGGSTGGETGVTDHGALTGLGDDDHPQYLNQTRGDSRYVQGNDARLSDARTPTSHTHTSTSISDSTTVGRNVLTAADAAAARTAIGAGTSNLTVGTTGSTAKAGNYQPTAANISDSTATGRSLITAVDQAAARTAIGAADASQLASKVNTADLATAVAPIVEDKAGDISDETVARTFFGSENDNIISPWNTTPTFGPERWAVANMHASGAQTLTPSITANGSAQEQIVYVKMDGFNNGGLDPWRLEFDFQAPASGWASIYVALQQSNQTNLSGTADQYVVTHESPQRSGHVVIDFQVPEFNGAFTYLKIRLKAENNVTSGQILRMTNVSLKRIARVAPPMLVSYGFSPGSPTLWMRHTNSRAVRKTTKTLLNGGGIASTQAFNTWTPWRWSIPDPYFTDNTGGFDAKVGSDETKVGIYYDDLNVGNNDQILSVQKTDLSFELRGNVHGGEASAADNPVYRVDEGKGAGFVPWVPGLSLTYLKPCRRYQVEWDTTLTRTGDSTPFARVDHVTTVYDDGMMRTDRSTKFQASVVIGDNFEWMSSHKISPLWFGRIGKGQTVIADVDTRGLLSAPTSLTATPSASGGTLAAGSYFYAVTALSAFGQTTVSPVVSATTTGTTSSVALSWTAVTGATGYRIYRGSSSSTQTFLTEVATTTYTDTGAVTLSRSGTPPTTNTARTTSATRREVQASDATWAVWYDPDVDLCYANIYDRDALLTRPGVQAATTRLQMVPGSITKNYINAIWNTADGNISVNASTPAWTATHWSYIYSPSDPSDFQREVAGKAANLGALKMMYPTT